MARSFDYNHPNYTVVREYFPDSNVSGTTAGANFRVFQSTLLRAIHFVIVTLAANTIANWNVRVGGTTIASYAAGLLTAATTHTITLNRTLVSMTDLVDVVGVSTTVASVAVVYEFYTRDRASVT